MVVAPERMALADEAGNGVGKLKRRLAQDYFEVERPGPTWFIPSEMVRIREETPALMLASPDAVRAVQLFPETSKDRSR